MLILALVARLLPYRLQSIIVNPLPQKWIVGSVAADEYRFPDRGAEVQVRRQRERVAADEPFRGGRKGVGILAWRGPGGSPPPWICCFWQIFASIHLYLLQKWQQRWSHRRGRLTRRRWCIHTCFGQCPRMICSLMSRISVMSRVVDGVRLADDDA